MSLRGCKRIETSVGACAQGRGGILTLDDSVNCKDVCNGHDIATMPLFLTKS